LNLDKIIQGRGLSHTAVMIQVPPDSAVGMTPWMAGGGSTIRFIPEKNSIKPFVGNHGGKKGTYLLMADGSVRWVDSDICDKVLQEMCTIGQKSEYFDENVEEFAPLVSNPATTSKSDKVEKKAP
jgi:hypothetical protein